ncbi:MAG: LysR substrate-binding domain-containing protein, partial [Pseudomonadota bacterium]|nr:LysR substrate-binding domain-containing protein [Pseudomonadota bacterium]
ATSLETLRQMVAAGPGVTLIPGIACVPTPNLRYVPLEKKDGARRKIGLVWRASTPQKKLMQELVTLLRTA